MRRRDPRLFRWEAQSIADSLNERRYLCFSFRYKRLRAHVELFIGLVRRRSSVNYKIRIVVDQF